MKKSAFDELKESIRQSGEIRRGKRLGIRYIIHKPAD